MLSRITCSPPNANCYNEDEAQTPIIFWADEKCLDNKVRKKEKFVDPFERDEVKAEPEEKTNIDASSSVAFEIVGTIRFFRPTLDAIPENQQQDQASVDLFETETYAGVQEKSLEVSSPTSILGSFDCASSEVAPLRLFPGEDDSIGNAFQKSCKDEEGGFETFSFEGVSFEKDIDIVALSGEETDIADDESLEVWVDSVGTMNGFSIAKDFQSHGWDDETDSV